MKKTLIVASLVLLTVAGITQQVKATGTPTASDFGTLSISSPGQNATFVTGQNLPIRWTAKKLKNIDISLQLIHSSNNLVVKKQVNSKTGSLNYKIPTTLAPGSYRVTIKESMAPAFNWSSIMNNILSGGPFDAGKGITAKAPPEVISGAKVDMDANSAIALSAEFTIAAPTLSSVAVTPNTVKKNQNITVTWTAANFSTVAIDIMQGSVKKKTVSAASALGTATIKASFVPGNYTIRVYNKNNKALHHDVNLKITSQSSAGIIQL